MVNSHQEILLNAQKRENVGKKAQKLRSEGKIPAVLYGHGKKNQSITLDKIEFQSVFERAGETSLIKLSTADEKTPCIIRSVQFSPVKNNILHVDLLAVNLKEKIEADIPLVFVGESPAVRDEDGTLIEVKSEVHVEALPSDLVHEIEVDISSLNTFEDSLHIKDIKVPDGITILDNSDETIANIEPPRSEEELAALEEKPEVDVSQVESETQEGTAEATSEEQTLSEEKSE